MRTNDEINVRYICEMMLTVDDDLDYSIIEIKPSQINLQPTEILYDGVIECTDPLHNYINRNRIAIISENIIGTYRASQFGIPNVQEYENHIRQQFELEQLEN